MLSLLIVLLVAALPDAPAEPFACRALGPKETLTIDLDDTPLVDVARIVSCALDRNILFQPPTVGDKRVTVFGPRPIDRRGVEALWQSMLMANALVSERHGAYDVIRPAGP